MLTLETKGFDCHEKHSEIFLKKSKHVSLYLLLGKAVLDIEGTVYMFILMLNKSLLNCKKEHCYSLNYNLML